MVRPEIPAHPTRDQQDNHYPCCQKKTPRAIHADIVTGGVFPLRSLDRWRKQAWLLKNSLLASKGQNWRDRKCLGDPRESTVGLPDAILFLSILRERVFQQPQAISLDRKS